jgi:steroid delta-isomerase-like uncharacterized protein
VNAGRVRQTMAETTQESTRTAEEVVRSAFEALGRRDLEAMKEHYAEDVVEDVVPIGVLRGRAAVLRFFGELFAAVPDLETRVGRVVPGESQVAIEWRMSGTFSGAPFLDIDPTGRRVEMRGFDLFEVSDGLISSNTGYYDGAEFVRQVGLMPPQDSTAERALKSAFNAYTKLRKTINERTGG